MNAWYSTLLAHSGKLVGSELHIDAALAVELPYVLSVYYIIVCLPTIQLLICTPRRRSFAKHRLFI